MEPDLALQHPAAGGTRLITQVETKEVLTARRETDCRTALTRGLKEYLEQLRIDWYGGRQSRFVRVFHSFAVPEEVTEFPCAAVFGLSSAQYDSSSLSPQTFFVEPVESRVAMRKAGEFTTDLTVQVWTTDPQQRMALAAMLEDALNPVDWMSGFLLQLPHYHGAHAQFCATAADYADGSTNARARIQLASVTLSASVDWLRFVGPQPEFRPRIELEVADNEDVPEGGEVQPSTISLPLISAEPGSASDP